MGWMRHQRLEPKCIAIDFHVGDLSSPRYEFVFEDENYVLNQYVGKNDRVTVEDHWSEEVLAVATDTIESDAVSIAERMFENSHGNDSISKETVDRIIYKLMTGDLRLVDYFMEDD